MSTNLSNILYTEDFPKESDIDALEKQLDAQLAQLLSSPVQDTTSEDSSELTIKPLDPSSNEYKDIANSWSNRLGAGLDTTKALVNEGLGLFFDQVGADETAASYRRDAQQNIKDRQARPQPEISPSVTEEVPKIVEDFSEGEVLEALGKSATLTKGLLSEAIPSMSVTAGGFAAAKTLAPLVGLIPVIGGPLRLLTWAIGALSPGYLMMSGEGYKRAKELGADETSSKIAGNVAGVAGGALDFWLGGTIVNGAIKAVGRKNVINTIEKSATKEVAEEVVKNAEKYGTKETLQEILKSAGKVATVGGITEAGQVLSTELAAATAAGKAIDPKELTKQMIDEGALGVFGGGTLGGVSGAFGPMTRNAARKKLEKIKEEDEGLRLVETTVQNLDENPDNLDADTVQTINSDIVDRLVRRPISFLREKIDKFPLAGELYNEFANFYSRSHVVSGDYLQEISNIFNDVTQRYGKSFKIPFTKAIPKQLMDDIGRKLSNKKIDESKYKGEDGQKKLEFITELTKNSVQDEQGNVLEEAGPLRKLYDNVRQDLVNSGVDINYVTDYLGQSYKIPITGFGRRKAKKEMIRILQNNNAKNPAVRDALATHAVEIVENITEHNNVYTPDNTLNLFSNPEEGPTVPVSKKSFELERVIPPEVVEQLDEAGLVNNDAQAIISKYAINASRRMGIQELYNNFNDKLPQLGLTSSELKRVRDIFLGLQGNYKRIDGVSLRNLNEFATTFGYLTTLPFAGLVSVSEPFIVLSRVSPKHALMAAIKAGRVTLSKAIRSIRPKHKISELENEFNSMHQTADLALTDVIRDIGETSINKRITDAFFKATLLAQVTQFSRQMAYVAAKEQLQADLLLVNDEIVTGKTTPAGVSAIKRLREMGLRNIFSNRKRTIKGIKKPKALPKKATPKQKASFKKRMAKFEKDMEEMGQQILDEDNLSNVENQSLNWAKGNTDEAPMLIRTSLAKTVDEIIMSPNIVNRPLWMSNPRLALLAQLKGFMMVFGNTIGPKFWNDVIKPMSFVHQTRAGKKFKVPTVDLENTFKYALMFTLFVSAMYGLQTIKDAIRYEDEDDSPLKDLDEVETMFYFLKQSNILGAGNVFLNAAESQKYGTSVFGSISPVLGKVEQLMKAIYNLTDRRPRSLANWLSKNTPFTGALGTDRRADIPFVGTDDWEKILEELLKVTE